MATSIDTVIESPAARGQGTPTGNRQARREALAAARQAFATEKFGAECRVRNDDIVYVVCRDGVRRLTKSPDGKTTSERRV